MIFLFGDLECGVYNLLHHDTQIVCKIIKSPNMENLYEIQNVNHYDDGHLCHACPSKF